MEVIMRRCRTFDRRCSGESNFGCFLRSRRSVLEVSGIDECCRRAAKNVGCESRRVLHGFLIERRPIRVFVRCPLS